MWSANNISCDYVTIPKPTWSSQVKPCTGRSHFNSVFLERKRFSLSICARFTVTQSRAHSAHTKHCANSRDTPLVPVFLGTHSLYKTLGDATRETSVHFLRVRYVKLNCTRSTRRRAHVLRKHKKYTNIVAQSFLFEQGLVRVCARTR